MITRRTLLNLSLGALAAPALMRSATAQQPEVTLRLHHFLPPTTTGQRLFMEPWAEKIAKASEGRLKIEIFPSMQLGGKPPQLFDQARDGVVDIIWTLPGYMPGRFPLIETFELPFLTHHKASVNSKALQEFADKHLQDEFKEVHPLCFWTHDHGVIHANRPIVAMEDMKGLKLRFPTRLAGEALKTLGASPIGMPVPQVPESLAQGVIDGAVLPWEVVPSVKVQELVKYHTEIPGSPTLYIATFVLAMNRTKYNALPSGLRDILDAHSGMAASEIAGAAWDMASPQARELARTRGNDITQISETEAKRWRETTKPVIDAWLASMKERGVNGETLLADATAALSKYAE